MAERILLVLVFLTLIGISNALVSDIRQLDEPNRLERNEGLILNVSENDYTRNSTTIQPSLSDLIQAAVPFADLLTEPKKDVSVHVQEPAIVDESLDLNSIEAKSILSTLQRFRRELVEVSLLHVFKFASQLKEKPRDPYNYVVNAVLGECQYYNNTCALEKIDHAGIYEIKVQRFINVIPEITSIRSLN